jgi:hypothetical protein
MSPIAQPLASDTGHRLRIAAANRGVLPIAPATMAWLYGSHRRAGWHPVPIEVGTDTLPVWHPGGVLSPASVGNLERRWRIQEDQKRLLAHAQAVKRKVAHSKHSEWLASCRAVLKRRREHVAQKRQALFMKLRVKSRCMYAEEAHAAAQEHAHHVQRSIGQEELRSMRLATLAKLSDARTDAAGWRRMTVIDSSVADTILDSDVEMEPQAVADAFSPLLAMPTPAVSKRADQVQ